MLRFFIYFYNNQISTKTMCDQLQFVAIDLLAFQRKSLKNDTQDIPQLMNLPSVSECSTSFYAQESASKEIFIEESATTQTSHMTQRNQTKSVLHNMQKHFFTFIQYLTPKKGSIIQHDQGYGEEVQKCLNDLIQVIKTQKRKTKEQLVPLFGQFNEKQVSRPSSSYRELASKYLTQTLRISLGLLKEHFVSSIKCEKTISEYLEKSKMQKKAQFKKYMESFIEEVESNKFKFRLTKESQQKMKFLVTQQKKNSEEWECFVSLN